MKSTHQLAELFVPKNYKLNLRMQRAERKFEGTVTITGKLLAGADEVLLHAKELMLTAAIIDGKPATIKAEANEYDEISLSQTGLQAGEHTIAVTFHGVITDPMHGLYPSKTTVDGRAIEILSTQFESHHAREVFPCVDEPAAKATFDVELRTEQGITVMGNMPVKQQTEDDAELVTVFETTPVMSTYLLAWAAGDLVYKEAKTKGGIAVRAYTTADKIDQTAYALDVGVRALEFYNEYFGVPYPLPKYDMVAIPDFSSGAMENWGIVTFREAGLLVDPKNTPLRTKQYVAMVIVHELAHQWFGNLVTMKWWDDLWLNESFANWMEYYVLDKLYPEWQLWLQFYAMETSGALDKDSLANVQKVRQPVNHPDEIRTLFDPAIVYAKGGSLLRMLHAHIGDEDCRKGLQLYMKRFAYQNTSAFDLLNCWDEVSTKDVKAFMEPWITQAGHPVVVANIGERSVELHQRRFYSHAQKAKEADATLWPVPLFSGALEVDVLEGATATATVTGEPKDVQINHGRAGFYPVLYDEAHLQRLAAAVREGRVDPIDRLGLLNDAYDFARNGQQSTKHLLALLKSYEHESLEPVWNAILDCIGALKMFADDDEVLRAKLRQFVGGLAAEQFNRLGWDKIPGEPHFDELLRPQMIGLMCYSEQPQVLQHVAQLFAVADSPEDVRPDIRPSVFAAAAKHGTADDFSKLLGWLDTTTSAQVRIQLIAGLTSTRDRTQLKQLLAMIATDKVKLQDVFYWFIYLCRSRDAKYLTWDWMVANWGWITEKFGSDMHYDDFSSYSSGGFSKAEDLQRYKDFFEPMIGNPAIGRSIKQGIEAIEARMLWRERDQADVTAFLQAL